MPQLLLASIAGQLREVSKPASWSPDIKETRHEITIRPVSVTFVNFFSSLIFQGSSCLYSELATIMATGFNLSLAEVGVGSTILAICVAGAHLPWLDPLQHGGGGRGWKQTSSFAEAPCPWAPAYQVAGTPAGWLNKYNLCYSPAPSNSISCATLDTVASGKELVR